VAVDLFAVAMGAGCLAWSIGNVVFFNRVTKLFDRLRDETRAKYGDARGWHYIMAVMAPKSVLGRSLLILGGIGLGLFLLVSGVHG
jgi:hypothetical protein